MLRKLLLVFLILFIIPGCSKNITSSSENKGVLKINLTDAPGNYEAVNITFSEVSVKFENDWKIINNQTQTFNLLTLTNGKTALLGESELEPGKYNQIRLKISAAEVVYKGQTFTLTVPSGAHSGLKFGPSFNIEPGITYKLIVDFDANKSIVPQGQRNNYKGFILKPFIRVIPEAETGAISGTVANGENSPIAYAIAGTDTVTSTVVDTTTCNFVLGYLPEGLYTVNITDTEGKSYTKSGVTVTAGKTTSIGEITLK